MAIKVSGTIVIDDSSNLKNLTSIEQGLNILSDARVFATSSIALGSLAAPSATGARSVYIGYDAGNDVTDAGDNAFVGYQAGDLNTTGYSNTYIGSRCGDTNTNTFFNTAVGADAEAEGIAAVAVGKSSDAGHQNSVVIGWSSLSTAINQITLGNASHTVLRCNATTITALSDERDKTNIAPVKAGLDFVNRLNPVDFVWNTRDGARVDQSDIGFIAQDLQKVQEDTGITIPYLVSDVVEDKLEASYGKLLPVMVQAIKDLSAKVEELEQLLQEKE